jgi:hypothetical protein
MAHSTSVSKRKSHAKRRSTSVSKGKSHAKRRSHSTSSAESHANIILDSVTAYARGKGYQFGSGADAYMRAHATNAAMQIDALPKSKQTQKLKKTEDSFNTLVDEMINEAHTIPGYEKANPGIIGEDTLKRALLTLCPLWPFC